MHSKLLPSLVLIALAGLSTAQPAKIAWSRTSSYPGIAIDTVGHAIVNAAGDYVLVGSDQQVGQLPKGNITIFNRKTAAMQFVDIVPPGNGPLGLSRIMEDEGIYYVFGTTRPIGSNSDQIYVGKFDSALNLMGQASFNANTYTGTETATDVGIDVNNNIYITGIAQKNNIWQIWVAKTTPTLASFAMNFQKVDITNPSLPQLTVNGIIAILIGFVSNTGPVVRGYKPTGPLSFSWGTVYPGNAYQIILENTMISGYCLASSSWIEMPTPGNFVSHAAIYKFDGATGVQAASYALPVQNGQATLSITDIIPSTNLSRRVNILGQRQGFAVQMSLNFDTLAVQSSWIDPLPSTVQKFVGATAWGDVLLSLGRANSFESLKGNAVNNVTKFTVNTPAYNMLLPYIEQTNLFHLESGDFLAIRADPSRMQVNCIQQPPVAVTDSYTARSGITFRPTLPVTTNDRYVLGSGLSLLVPPMHGSVTVGTNGFFQYKSTAGYTGPDSFKYQLLKSGLTPSSATINMTVVP